MDIQFFLDSDMFINYKPIKFYNIGLDMQMETRTIKRIIELSTNIIQSAKNKIVSLLVNLDLDEK